MAPLPRSLQCNPLVWLPAELWQACFIIALVSTALLMAGIHVTNAPLENPVAPWGMVSLQLAGSLDRAQEVLASWGPAEQKWALCNLVVDFLYLVSYAVTLALGCLLLAQHFRGRPIMAQLGGWLAWGVVVAACLDAAENVLLIRMLGNDLHVAWAVLIYWCAVPKFVLIMAALVYLCAGGLIRLIGRGGWPQASG